MQNAGMRSLAALLTTIFALTAVPLSAQDIVYEEVTYEWVEVDGAHLEGGSERFVSSHGVAIPQGLAVYGPFLVLDETRAALVDVTDTRSPEVFAAMMRDFPGIGVIEMIDCPGTEDDAANLRLGRMIRDRGIVTYVPQGGSVRSGAVELFLAGARRIAEPGAEFAVHAWLDDTGREATDYAANDPENAKYIAYYRQMGLSAIEAAAFYEMTNSVPHRQAKWLNASQMALWVRLDS